jgi:DNA-binding transcriptional LysR family regulator
MRFERLDLNLLIVLDALLRDVSVSGAADRINLSQSATSSALARLRQHFEDELLVMKGRGMVLTPRAEELIEPVSAVLSQIRDTILTTKPFDPATSDRRLTIMTSDYSVEILVAPTLRAIAAEAPNITFQLLRMPADPIEQLERGAADICIAPDTIFSTEHPTAPMFVDDFVVVGWRESKMLSGDMTLELYQSLGHVVTRFGRGQSPSFEEWVHRHQLITRRIEVIAPDFSSVATLVSGSDRIATMHRRLAQRLQLQHDLKVMRAPFDIPQVRIAAQWPKKSTGDPALKWLIERLERQAAVDFVNT